LSSLRRSMISSRRGSRRRGLSTCDHAAMDEWIVVNNVMMEMLWQWTDAVLNARLNRAFHVKGLPVSALDCAATESWILSKSVMMETEITATDARNRAQWNQNGVAAGSRVSVISPAATGCVDWRKERIRSIVDRIAPIRPIALRHCLICSHGYGKQARAAAIRIVGNLERSIVFIPLKRIPTDISSYFVLPPVPVRKNGATTTK